MTYPNQPAPVRPKEIITWVAAVVAVIGMLIGIVVGCILLFAAVGRHNRLASAKNNVKISTVEIANQEQRVTVAKQQAEIRLQNAVGVREAQDEIAKTLTPLYVQYEMVQALEAIATSGKNNSIVYVPSGANGIPLVSTVNPSQVTSPDVTK